MKMYSASEIAVHFVRRGIEERNYLTQMKLQKMVYFAQGYHLARYGQKLIKDEVQAWQYGPVFPSLYDDYKLYGGNPIETFKFSRLGENPTIPRLTPEAQETINFTWNTLKNISAAQLSNWTHKPDSPWDRAYREGERGVIIPENEIKAYFKEILGPNVAHNG